MSPTAQAVLLVDPVRVGTGYKKAARDLGYAVVSLYSVRSSAAQTGHATGDDVSLYVADIDLAVDQVAGCGYDIAAVVPGMEAGVFLADKLAERLGLPGNDHNLAWARRNKAAMRARAQEAGLRIPAFRLVRTPAEIADAARDIGFPAIAKPTMGASAQGVTLLPDEAAVADPARFVTHDAFDEPVREWLVEQYVRGRELSVNCYSAGGDHRVVDMWDYRQPSDADYDFPIWDNIQLDAGDTDWDRARDYVFAVLDAFGVRLGPSHLEIKCTPDGVYLMELGARLPGGPMVEVWDRFADFDPMTAALRCYLGQRPAMMDRSPVFSHRAAATAIRNDEGPGTLTAIHGLDDLRAIPGVYRVLVDFQPGDHVPLTRDNLSIPVGAYLSGDTVAELLGKLALIRSTVRLDIARR